MKYLLSALLLLFGARSFAQHASIEGQVTKGFESIKNNDAQLYKSLWPSGGLFCAIFLKAGRELPEGTGSLYCESRYYGLLADVLGEFVAERNNNPNVDWADLYIQKIDTKDEIAFVMDELPKWGGYIWLKSRKNAHTNYIYEFTNLVFYEGHWYGGLYKGLRNFEGSFEEAKKESRPIYYRTSQQAALDSAAIAASEMLYRVIEQGTYSTMVNGKQVLLSWTVTGYTNDGNYNETTYRYSGKDQESFDQIINLSAGYFLLLEADGKSYFRLKKTLNGFTGVHFAAGTGKEVPVNFISTEVKK